MTVEVMERDRLERYHVQFYIKVASRKVELGGIRCAPTARWVNQAARNMVDSEDGFLLGQKYLIHDRDPVFTDLFRAIMKTSGITPKRIRPHCPNMNAHIERFIQSIEVECLDRLNLTSEEELRYVVSEYLMYYNHERPHQGLGNVCIEPLPQDDDGDVIEFSRLGGMLRSYRRLRTDNPDYSKGKPLIPMENAA